jgi:hypothetical protein
MIVAHLSGKRPKTRGAFTIERGKEADLILLEKRSFGRYKKHKNHKGRLYPRQVL